MTVSFLELLSEKETFLNHKVGKIEQYKMDNILNKALFVMKNLLFICTQKIQSLLSRVTIEIKKIEREDKRKLLN